MTSSVVASEYRPSMVHAEPNPTIYVLGFAFSHSMRSVVLIEKQKPAWQAGKLNGIGGKVERGELPLDAMTREFCEETGWGTRNGEWHLFEIMRFRNGAIVYCYACKLLPSAEIRTVEQERVDAYPIDDADGSLRSELPIINNLNWLIPKAFHQIREPKEERMLIE